ncbi:hypothetical protein DPMN_010504 [Dreissena polymorpha]|uniref:Uncharacterized protein n=1 Tax=Dreissena polymorpha TaxID=45954 RepID=A0A9D4N3B8_DREPO|nr:hypothetical protein DPMN_010504 [Dreissena polymorpha]
MLRPTSWTSVTKKESMSLGSITVYQKAIREVRKKMKDAKKEWIEGQYMNIISPSFSNF